VQLPPSKTHDKLGGTEMEDVEQSVTRHPGTSSESLCIYQTILRVSRQVINHLILRIANPFEYRVEHPKSTVGPGTEEHDAHLWRWFSGDVTWCISSSSTQYSVLHVLVL
jgi:hypothetical protein